MKRWIAAAAVAGSVLAMGTPAFAGEITGSGKGGPANDGQPGGITHANSICTFSGLSDGEDETTHTQNWGRLPKDVKVFLTSIGHNPGIACNAHLFPYPPGPPEP